MRSKLKRMLDMLIPAKHKHRCRLTNVELKAYRQLFMLDVKTAAEIAECSVQAWYSWERGDSPVPERIGVLMDGFQADYQDLLTDMILAIRKSGQKICAMRYYETAELYASHYPKACVMDWKIYQIVAARLLVDELVYLVSAEKIEGEICGE